MLRLKSIEMSSSLQERLKRFLTTGKVPHFLLFHAHEEESAGAIANGFLLDWLEASPSVSSHVDLLTLQPEGKLTLHTVAQVGGLLKELSLAPYSGMKRGVLIRHIDRMLPSSSNALLKALEEPLCRTVFIGTTEKPHRLLPTIRSRAHEIAIPLVVLNQQHSEGVQAVVELVLKKMPLASFTSMFSLCDELVSCLEKQIKSQGVKSSEEERVQFLLEELAVESVRAIVKVFHSTLPHDKQRLLLVAGEHALDALDKHTSVRDSYIMFFSSLIGAL